MGSKTVTGKLDEISRVIGQQEANVAGLKESFDRHCSDDDRRHSENKQVLQEIASELRNLNDCVKPLAQTVGIMKPIVDGYQVTRWKAIGFIAAASVFLGFLGWALSLIVGKALAWALSLMAFK